MLVPVTPIIAFEIETTPEEPYKRKNKSALNAHKSHIVGISFSAAKEDAIYLPVAHLIGQNGECLPEMREWLASEFFANSTRSLRADKSGSRQVRNRHNQQSTGYPSIPFPKITEFF